ncbi:hypothetical protein C8F01DRAFT_1156665 [Mycena amicta]|nr:hypothetical protein C8F01DRAFT_1156665 [Mycena amicta]
MGDITHVAPSDSIQGLLDTVVAGTAEKIKDAIELAKTTTAILKELGAAKLRGISPWVEAVKKNAGLGGVHHALMKEALEDVFKGKGIEKLTELDTQSMVQSKILEMSGRTTMLTKLVSKLKDTRTVRIILVSLVLVVIDTIDSALNGGVTAAVLTGIKGVVGSAAGIVGGIF